MPQDLVGEKADVQRLYDAVNILLYLQVIIYILTYFLNFVKPNELTNNHLYTDLFISIFKESKERWFCNLGASNSTTISPNS